MMPITFHEHNGNDAPNRPPDLSPARSQGARVEESRFGTQAKVLAALVAVAAGPETGCLPELTIPLVNDSTDSRVSDTGESGRDDCPEDQATPWYPDADEDGFGSAEAEAIWDCEEPVHPSTGFIENDNTDCDDHNSTIHPGAEDEPGDGVDGDCDGTP